MFGIGGGELVLIIFITLMLFGAEKIPEIARTLGKGMAQIKNATNDIKNEITKSADANDIDIKSLAGNFKKEVDDIKQGFTNVVTQNTENLDLENTLDIKDISKEINQTTENLEDLSGPIKRRK
jgi:sec-independent protein translocase protein TatA